MMTASALAKDRRVAGSSASASKFLPPSDADLLAGAPVAHLWSDVVSHLFSHPSLKLSTLRSVPQLSRSSRAFASDSWRALLRSLVLMGLQAADSEDGLDHSVATWSNHREGLPALIRKQKWHKHYSSSARAASLYDPYTLFDASPAPSSSPNSAAAAAAAASSSSGLSSPPTPQQIQFDAPLAHPPYLVAYRDGESYLEARLQVQLAEQQQQQQLAAHNNTRRAAENQRNAASASSARSAELDDADGGVPEYITNLSSLLMLRGQAVCAADATPLLDPSLYSSASLNPLQVLRSPAPVLGMARSACLWSNGQAVVRPLDRVLSGVYKQLHAQAYTHHYRKYGLEIDDLWQCVAAIEQVNADYKNLSFRER
jgi:hypothetical protein